MQELNFCNTGTSVFTLRLTGEGRQSLVFLLADVFLCRRRVCSVQELKFCNTGTSVFTLCLTGEGRQSLVFLLADVFLCMSSIGRCNCSTFLD